MICDKILFSWGDRKPSVSSSAIYSICNIYFCFSAIIYYFKLRESFLFFKTMGSNLYPINRCVIWMGVFSRILSTSVISKDEYVYMTDGENQSPFLIGVITTKK
jgi:hypothetical protein